MKNKKKNKPLNICHFGHKNICSREGGVEIVVKELATRMVEQGHKVTCYNRMGHHVAGEQYDVEKMDYYKGVKMKSVFTINKKGIAAMSASFFAAVQSALSKVDVVHIHAEGPAFMSFISKMFGKRVIVTVHGLDWQRAKWGKFSSWYIKQGEKNAVRFADEIIVLSRGVQDYFKAAYNRETQFIPNGVTKPEIREAKLIKEKYGLEKDDYILFLGRIVPEKGLRYLIQAFKDVETEKKLVIAGGSSDTDDFMLELKEMAKDDERIIFTGFVQDRTLEELYSNAYIYTLPSDLEGMPLSLLEAMSYRNCCVVSNIDECVEVVEDKAVVFEKSNIQDLKIKLDELCRNKDIVQRYKDFAENYICQKYNWNEVVEKTMSLYRR